MIFLHLFLRHCAGRKVARDTRLVGSILGKNVCRLAGEQDEGDVKLLARRVRWLDHRA